MNSKWKKFFLIILSFFLFGFWTIAKTPKVKITGIFSNMHYVEEAGDVVGMEIFLIYSNKGYFAVVQIAEGSPTNPVLVNVKVTGELVEFTLPPSTGNLGTFQGKVTAQSLSGLFNRQGEKIQLLRKKSYWQ